MIIHSEYQIIKNREKRFDVLIHKPFLERSEAEHLTASYFLRNPEIFCYFVLGVEILPFQGVILRMLLRKPFAMILLGRGCGKTFMLGVYSCFRAISSPGSKIVQVGSNRRQSRFIFDECKKIYYNKKASLFRQLCPKEPNDLPEGSSLFIRGADKTSSIVALPLAAGNRIRGARASHLLVDEFAIIPEEIFNLVLKPLGSVALAPVERVKRVAKEKELLESGVISKEDLTEFSDNQVVASSSASYMYTYMYRLYCEYEKKILSAKDSKDIDVIRDAAKYGIFRAGVDAISELSPGYMDEANVELARATSSQAVFESEYLARWVSDSGGVFPRSLLETRQIKIGESPSVEIKGKPNEIYLMSVDPSSGENINTDWFAIVVIRLDMTTKKAYVVYASASTGKGWPHYVNLVRQKIKDFSPRYIVCDAYGGGIQLSSLLCSSEFLEKSDHKILKTLDKDDLSTYSWVDNRILRLAIPTNSFNENSNNLLKSYLDHASFFFGGAIGDSIYTNTKTEEIDEYEAISERIEEAKSQISLIVGTQGQNGLITFNMPNMMANAKRKERGRKDLYSAILLGAVSIKEYIDICNIPSQQGGIYNPTVDTA